MSEQFNAASALSNFINGAWLPGSGAELVTIDPSNGRQTWASLAATEADVEQACLAARAAFDGWADTPLAERIATCVRFRDLLKTNAEELALLISEEVGKPLWESRTEVATMANKIDISVQSICCHGDTPGSDTIVRTVREALDKAGCVVKPLREWLPRV